MLPLRTSFVTVLNHSASSSSVMLRIRSALVMGA
nr:MAG TPA: hypothetical protein [Bacteriophage sp.]